MFLIVFSCPALDLHTPCHCSSDSRWRSGQDLWEMSSCWAATSECFCNTVLESDSSCEQESLAAMGLQEHDEHTGNDALAWRTWQRLSAREFDKDFFTVEVCELAKRSSLSIVGFRDHLFPVSATLMLFSALVLVRPSVLLLPVGAT